MVVFFVATCSVTAALFSKDKPAERKLDYAQDIKPLLKTYCYDCHDDDMEKGDLSLESYESLAAILNDKAVWEKVLNNVTRGEMPPTKKPQPTDEERKRIAHWIEKKVFDCDCDNPDPGRVTLRRLNRTEYNNTIRDLIGVEFEAAADFPNDDTGYGFDNIGDVLSLPPILLEKYMTAAGKILDAAIVTDFQANGVKNRFEAEKISRTESGDILKRQLVRLGREGEVFTSFNFKQSGSYVFRVRAYGEQAGNEPARMEFRVNGQVIKTVDVTAQESSPAIYEVQLKLAAGTNKLSAAYINNYLNREDPDPNNRDRNLVIDYLEIVGPAGPPILPTTHQRIFKKPVPSSIKEKKHYAREILESFSQRAFRRPVTARELDRLMAFVELAQSDGENFESGIKLAMHAVLVSPHFIFRGETQLNPNNSKAVHPIDEYALASRLSYFLWSSMPDDQLFALAKRGQLRKNLESQVNRMLRDEKSRALVENFAGQWLQLRNLDFVTPDAVKFPEFDEPLRLAMRTETELFFKSLLKENSSVLDMLDGKYSFLNERLARHYGIPGISGEEFRRVSLKGTPRSGILTHGSILTLTSNPTRTSPVKRGKFVLENLLGTPPPPPPPDVSDLKDETPLSGTLRQQLEQHRADPNCASCHARMDPIGFAFENFDGTGAWRLQDGKNTIDSTGQLVSGESFTNAVELRSILSATKSDQFVRCLSEKLLTYSLGRGLEIYDKCAIDEISKNVAGKNYKFREFIIEVVKSVPFQMRRGEQHLTQAASVR